MNMIAQQISQTRNRLLIIDDDFINREVLKNIFTGRFEFEEAENGLEGLKKLLELQDHLCAVLLDVNMPVMNGMELLRWLHQRDRMSQVPVFLITASEELEVAREAYDLGVMGVINKPVVPFIVQRRVELVVELFQAREALDRKVQNQAVELTEKDHTIDALHRSTIEALASAIEFRDLESGEHTNRIYGITKEILQHTPMGEGFSPEEIENMAIGSIMHDIGKIAISDVILNKPGRLTPEEFETMKQHTVKGAALMDQLLKGQSHPSYLYARDIALHHHERWDGRGYPEGLKGNEITPWSQVVSIADVYDALISPRVYKRSFPPDRAVEMICSGECGTFNPKLISCFLSVEPTIRKWYFPDTPSPQAPQRELAELPGEPSKELVDVLLLTEAVRSAYDLIILANLTRNSYSMMNYDRDLSQSAGPDGVFDDLLAAGAAHVPDSHRRQFLETFSRENLMNAYSLGKKSVHLDHPQFNEGGQLMSMSTSVLFMKDPRSGDLREITLSRCSGEYRPET